MVFSELSIFGKLSRFLSYRLVLKNLKKGNWLDLMSGYNADLLREGKKLFTGNSKMISDYYALDIKLNKKLKTLNIKTFESLIRKKIAFKDNTFDNISVIDGLEHLFHPQDILNECFWILKPGGRLIVMVPTWQGKPILEFIAFRLKDPQSLKEMNDHKMYFDEKTLWPMAVRAGFKPSNIEIKKIKFGYSLYLKAIKQ